MPTPIRGADVSMTAEIEQLGAVFRADGTPHDLFELLAAQGVNWIRLRLWVDPRDETGAPYLGGTNDLATTVALARRAKAAGHAVLLDLHYSDFWTDPKKQSTPKAWRDLQGAALEARVHDWTSDVLAALEAAGAPPDMVQVGNEITNGMLWPEGRTPRFIDAERRFDGEDPAAFDRLTGLLAAGTAAVREAGLANGAGAQVMIHLDFGGANELYRGWFDQATARGLDFDVIGLSYYPYWHGTLQDLGANLNDLAGRYGKDLVVVETAYAWTGESPAGHHQVFKPELAEAGGYPASPEGQTAFLRDLYATVDAVPGGRGLGIVYWEPAWLPVDGTTWASRAGMEYGDDVVDETGSSWANQALFDFDGNALASLRALGGG
ncbi:glycoside hydrolase family 53 protein [Glycomyces algeriensis]|uniref:Arabinogalactan endo-beta-1,4-galactanase n=1 Tax=Glycomyces algeriensis TaxID=256037 RepID=A0A9W6LIB9_9ACTN|nr:glycosyl hydrolase 53 family protein [Glycomyces algeriensis]MDA1364779.1 glycosyl hydrolase 53 family protein [Glycomyces algeriensis]MDR7350820.1 arabinogalactan endo-1,4-beta-galactosidase [Glycomyces algeriensis]GLI43531.1 arabinogalactan endo-beta-1,4-galactanase [Glycomyces algeriensis]